MQVSKPIDAITYRCKEKDKGLIIGSRQCHWMLKKKYSPCYAIDLVDGQFISVLSQHRRNFKVYIPAKSLVKGHAIRIHNDRYRKDPIDAIYKVIDVNNTGVQLQIVKGDIK